MANANDNRNSCKQQRKKRKKRENRKNKKEKKKDQNVTFQGSIYK